MPAVIDAWRWRLQDRRQVRSTPCVGELLQSNGRGFQSLLSGLCCCCMHIFAAWRRLTRLQELFPRRASGGYGRRSCSRGVRGPCPWRGRALQWRTRQAAAAALHSASGLTWSSSSTGHGSTLQARCAPPHRWRVREMRRDGAESTSRRPPPGHGASVRRHSAQPVLHGCGVGTLWATQGAARRGPAPFAPEWWSLDASRASCNFA